jgi:hypothetical protein
LQCKWQSDQAILEIDAMVEEDRLWQLGGWLDSFIKIDVSWQEILTNLQLWLNERQSFEALKLVATAIQHQGSRVDLDTLRDYQTTSDPRVAELIEDSEFVVKRRSIV